MTLVLIINLYKDSKNEKNLVKNLNYYQIPFNIKSYKQFDKINFYPYSHIILTGSEFFTYKNQIALNKQQIDKLVSLNKPILAICYGFHLLAYHLVSGVIIRELEQTNKGFIKINSPLTDKEKNYFFNHKNYINKLDNNWTVLTSQKITNNNCKINLIIDAKYKNKSILGLQYHPEKTADTYGLIFTWIQLSNKSIFKSF